MRQPCAVEIVFAGLKYLRLRLQTSEGVGEDDPVALNLKGVAIVALSDRSVGKAFEIEVVIESVLHAILACLPRLVSLQVCFISIMKYPKSTFVLGLWCAVAVLSALSSTAEARIGESKSELERRLLGRGGLAYRDDAILDARQAGKPYKEFLPYLESDVDIQVYHKSASADKKALRSKFNAKRMLPGWDLHVVYINGKSAIELYERSPKMTEQEFHLLLLLQGDGKRWTKREADGIAAGADSADAKKNLTAFGFQMVRNDGVVRAKKMENSVLFVDADKDALFAQARDDERNSDAPESVNGF